MLRIGKNPKDQDDEHSTDKQNASAYNTPRDNYPSYQGNNMETKSAAETPQVSAKALLAMARQSPARQLLKPCCVLMGTFLVGLAQVAEP